MDAVRLAVGTLSVLPVAAPRRVDRPTWGRAMLLAPVVGAVLGAVAWAFGVGATRAATPLLGAVAVVAVDAALTRGLHLDGLADVADGLGSRLPADRARAVMKQSDIGPFGVVTLVLVLLLQVAALQQVLALSTGPAAAALIIGAAVASRASLTLSCRRGLSAAGDGLGSAVVGSVPTGAGWATVAAVTVVVIVAGLATDALVPAAVSVIVALASAELWRRRCVRRFDGVTGDVLGSVQQVGVTVFLLAAALAS
jgi:adenosylcobinamide-GDP ribazoletransferase